ncbi:hypothetical protein Tco_0379770, partial [Tanacetum coccineum]
EVVLYALYLRCSIKSRLRTRIPSRPHLGGVTQESKVDTGKALDVDLVDTESIRTDSTVQDDSSRSGNDTDADDVNIRPIYDEEPMAEYPEKCQVKSLMLDSSPDNQITEYSKQSLESENMLLKKIVA